MSFKLTYATMFNPPADMHRRFDAALAEVNRSLGATHGLYINGEDRDSARHDTRRSPIDQRRVLGHFPLASVADANDAMAAAQAAFPSWRAIPMVERVRLLKGVATLIEERVYHIAAALTLEVGKNRMEALGEVQETADFFNLYADDFVRQNGFDHALPDDPLPGFRSHNRSVMKPYGVWVVIAPYNFPFALAGGPVAAALITGNTVVLKTARDTPWSGRLLADCLRDAGIPRGVFNYLNGGGSVIGDALLKHPNTAGITFTGSVDVGMHIYRSMANGLQHYERYSKQLRENGGRVLSGGQRLTDGDLAHGYFVAPTLAEAPATHPLFAEEMFVPIAMLCRVRDRTEAVRLANDSQFGLTAGCYGNDEDAAYFFDNIEAGVTYVNRPQGATTGAWPGYQPFGGWKGSGSSGKGIASFYYLAQYQREQSQTKVE